MSMFKKAVKSASKIKMSLHGAAGSGKTYSALTLAFALGSKVAILDTENNSASLYAGSFPEFDILNLKPPYEPERFSRAIDAAEKESYDVIIIDSFSAEWEGEGGCLDLRDKLGGRFQDWAKVTPRHDKLIEKILRANIHIICCMRAKTSYSLDTESNKAKVSKLGLAPIQRDNVEYNFTLCFALNNNNMVDVVKDRTGLFIGKNFMITKNTGEQIFNWLTLDDQEVIKPEKLKLSTEAKKLLVDILAQKDFFNLLNADTQDYIAEVRVTKGAWKGEPATEQDLQKVWNELLTVGNKVSMPAMGQLQGVGHDTI